MSVLLFWPGVTQIPTVSSSRRRYVDDPLYAVAIGNRLPMNVVTGDSDNLDKTGARDGDFLEVRNGTTFKLASFDSTNDLWQIFDTTTTLDGRYVNHGSDGEGTEEINYVDFDTNYVDGQKEGRLQWNTEDGTLEVGLPGGNVNLQIGQETLTRVTNDQGATITNGQLVRISGATGSNPLIKLADKSSISTAGVIGFATEDILDGQKGYVTHFGLVRDVDTSSHTVGLPLWLGDDGNYTTTVPTAPDTKVVVGVVIRQHATEGVILCTIANVPRLRGLSDVYSPTTPDNGNIINWDTSNSRFKIGGSRIKSTETSTTTATMSDDVEVHFCNGTTAYTLTLPTQTLGKQIRIINKNTGVITLTPASGEISGETTQQLLQHEVYVATSDGTDWY